VARPTSMHIETFGTGKVDEETLLRLVKDHFDLRPAAIIKNFDLQNLPSTRKGRFYQDVAAYGHMGRNDLDLPWELLDKVELLKKNA
jgi:S-adenosylmethionine synthetase